MKEIDSDSDSQISIHINKSNEIHIHTMYTKLHLKSLEKIFYCENVYKVVVYYRRACESSYQSTRVAHSRTFVDKVPSQNTST